MMQKSVVRHKIKQAEDSIIMQAQRESQGLGAGLPACPASSFPYDGEEESDYETSSYTSDIIGEL